MADEPRDQQNRGTHQIESRKGQEHITRQGQTLFEGRGMGTIELIQRGIRTQVGPEVVEKGLIRGAQLAVASSSCRKPKDDPLRVLRIGPGRPAIGLDRIARPADDELVEDPVASRLGKSVAHVENRFEYCNPIRHTIRRNRSVGRASFKKRARPGPEAKRDREPLDTTLAPIEVAFCINPKLAGQHKEKDHADDTRGPQPAADQTMDPPGDRCPGHFEPEHDLELCSYTRSRVFRPGSCNFPILGQHEGPQPTLCVGRSLPPPQRRW